MTEEVLVVILGMALVTYIPRMIPFVVFHRFDFPTLFKDVLKNLRYAILGGLIIPGVFLVQDDPIFGVIGGVVAVIIAYLDVDTVFVVLGTVGIMTIYAILI